MLPSNVANPAFDYVALGHIHKTQVLGHNPPLVYPGSLQSIDFGDEGQEKGFYVMELDPAEAQGQRLLSYEFHTVRDRPFLTIEVNADSEDPTATVHQAISRRKTENAIVRVRIRVPASRDGLVQEAAHYPGHAVAAVAVVVPIEVHEQVVRVGVLEVHLDVE